MLHTCSEHTFQSTERIKALTMRLKKKMDRFNGKLWATPYRCAPHVSKSNVKYERVTWLSMEIRRCFSFGGVSNCCLSIKQVSAMSISPDYYSIESQVFEHIHCKIASSFHSHDNLITYHHFFRARTLDQNSDHEILICMVWSIAKLDIALHFIEYCKYRHNYITELNVYRNNSLMSTQRRKQKNIHMLYGTIIIQAVIFTPKLLWNVWIVVIAYGNFWHFKYPLSSFWYIIQHPTK